MEDVDLLILEVVHGVSLEATDGNGFVFRTENAGAFAQFLDRTDARTRGTEQIRLENSAGGPQ